MTDTTATTDTATTDKVAADSTATDASKTTTATTGDASTTTTATQTPEQKAASDVAAAADVAAKATTTAGKWDDKWREELAGENKEILTQLKKFDSPKKLAESYYNSDKEFKSGKFQRKLSENPTAEEMAQWRKENGVPDSVDKYTLDLPKGLVLGEADKPLTDDFLKFALEKNMPQSHVTASLEWYARLQENAVANQAEIINKFKESSEEALRSEWGHEFKRNENIYTNEMSKFPESLRTTFESALTAEGEPLAHHPEFRRFIVNEALLKNPVYTITGNTGRDAMVTAGEELGGLRKELAAAVNQGKTLPPAKQARMAELVAFEKQTKKTA